MHWAATRGNTAVALALLDAGADGSARDGTGKTPLHCAAQVGHTSVVVALLDFYGFVPRGGLPPPAMPAMVGVGPWVGEKGLPSAAATRQHESAVASIVDARNAYGSTALHRAAFNGREGVVVALLSGGADVSVAGKSGRCVCPCFERERGRQGQARETGVALSEPLSQRMHAHALVWPDVVFF